LKLVVLCMLFTRAKKDDAVDGEGACILVVSRVYDWLYSLQRYCWSMPTAAAVRVVYGGWMMV
jgi:hypothetical protein